MVQTQYLAPLLLLVEGVGVEVLLGQTKLLVPMVVLVVEAVGNSKAIYPEDRATHQAHLHLKAMTVAQVEILVSQILVLEEVVALLLLVALEQTPLVVMVETVLRLQLVGHL
jgi:hypothetical protein